MSLDSSVFDRTRTFNSSLFEPTDVEELHVDESDEVETFHEGLDSLINTLEVPIDNETNFVSGEEYHSSIEKPVIDTVSVPSFVPYEIKLEDLADVAKRTISATKQVAFENGLLMRWASDNGPQIYLIRTEEEEQLFQIDGRTTYANDFDGYVDHDFEDNQSILFKNRHYPYSMSPNDITDLADRMEIQRELVADRIYHISKIDFAEFEGIVVSSRNAETEVLYTKATTKKIPPKRKNGRRRMTMDKRALQEENEIHGNDLTEEDYMELEQKRPRTYGECQDEPGPCVFVGCQYNLYLDVKHNDGHIQFNFPNTDVVDLRHTCALQEAEKGGMTLGAIEERLMITREGVRRIEVKALNKMRMRSIHLIDFDHSDPVMYRTRNSNDF